MQKGRPETKYNTSEVNEIIELKIKELNGRNDKLTYNNVWEFNKKIANNSNYVCKATNEKFKEYGYNFWSVKDIGREAINNAKSTEDIILAGENFDIDVKDIIVVIDKYYKNKDQLTKNIAKLFKEDRKKIELYKREMENAFKEIRIEREKREVFESGLAKLFRSSYLTTNSLQNIVQLNKSEDKFVYDELKNMFNKDEGKLEAFIDKYCNNSENSNTDRNKKDNVISYEDKKKEIALLEKEGLL